MHDKLKLIERGTCLVIMSLILAGTGIGIKTAASIELEQLCKNPFSSFDADTITRFNFIVFNDGEVSISPELQLLAAEVQISFYDATDFISLQETTNSSFQFDYANNSMTMVILSTENRSNFEYMVSRIEDYYYYNTTVSSYFKWVLPKRLNVQLYFLLVWPNALENEAGVAEAMKSLSKDKFTLPTNVYVLFPNVVVSSSELELKEESRQETEETASGPGGSSTQWQIWSSYSIKNVRVARLIFSSESEAEFLLNAGYQTKNYNSSDAKISMIPFYMSSKVQRRQNFYQVPITAIAVGGEDYPYEVLFAPIQNETDEPKLESGFGVSLFRDLEFTLNFSERATTAMGYIYRGSDIHMKLESGEADICISQNVYIPTTFYISTVLQPTFPLQVMAFCKDPTFAIRSTIFMKIFPQKEWIAISLIISLLIISVSVCTWIRNAYLRDYSQEVKAIEDEAFLWGFAYFCQRSWHVFPSSWSLKLIFFSGASFCLIIYSAYLGLLVSKLSVHNSMLNSFQDLLKENYTLAYNNNSVSMTYFVKGIQQYYDIPKVLALTFTEVESAITEQKVMLIYYWDSLLSILPSYQDNIEEFICNSIVGFPVDRGYVQSGFVMKKGSPFQDIFNNKIIKIKEHGLNKRYLNHYTIETQPTCLFKNRLYHLKLGLEETAVIFQVLSCSIIVSLCLLLAETVSFRLWNGPILPNNAQQLTMF